MKRIHYYVTVDGDGWALNRGGERIGHYVTQSEAEAAAFDLAREDQARGVIAEVNVQNREGRWSEEGVYGGDAPGLNG